MATALACGYYYDKPTVSGGVALANAWKFSGATRVLFPYRVIGAGLVGGAAIAEARASGMGTSGNPVVDVDVVSGELVITFADGTTETLDLPAGSSAVVDAPDGRLPGAPVEMRIAWSDGGPLTADQYTVAAGATVGTTAGLLNPDELPPGLTGTNYNLGFWFASAELTALFQRPAQPIAWQGYYTDPPVALEIDGVAGIQVWTSALRVAGYMGSGYNDPGFEWFAVVPGLLIATQTWVTARIADIMLSGGGITETQAQALIDTAVADFQTATEIDAIVAAAIAALPEYQTLAQVTTLITTAIDALTLGQTATEVQTAIDLHAAMPNAHHVPGGPTDPVEIPGPWTFVFLTPTQSGLVYYAAEALAGEVDTWIFSTGSNDVARAQLTDLEIGDVIRIEQSNFTTRYQTITLTLAPTIQGLSVSIFGTADRAGQFEIPETNAAVTVSVIPPSPVDQTARDDAATAQSDIDAHELTAHNTDTTARTAAAAATAEITAHEATPHGGGGGGSSTLAKTGAFAAPGSAANVWVSTLLTPSATATLVGIQFVDATLAAGGLTDVDDWVIGWLDGERLRAGKTARVNTRPSNQTRVYAIDMLAGVIRFRGNAIGAGEGLVVQVWEQ